jgi:hypothetical protein
MRACVLACAWGGGQTENISSGGNVSTFGYLFVESRLGYKEKKKLHGLSPRANYTDRATAACRRSDCQLLPIEGATWSA